MAAKKAPAKSARPAPRGRPRRAAVPAKTAAASAPSPAPPRPEPASPKPFPSATVGVALILIAGLALWCWHRSCAVPAPVPAPVNAAPVPSVPQAAAQAAPIAPNPVPRNERRSSGDFVTLIQGKTLALDCWRADQGQAELDIFNSRNRRVRSLSSPSGPEGWLKLGWDGRDDAGKAVRSGTYFARPSQKGDQLILEVKVRKRI